MKKNKKEKSPKTPQSARKYAVKTDPKKPKHQSPYKLPQGDKIELDVQAPSASKGVIKAKKNLASPYRLEPEQVGTSLLKQGKSKDILPPISKQKVPIIGAGSPIGVPPPNVVARYRRIMAEKEARRARSRSPVPLAGTANSPISGKKNIPSPPPSMVDQLQNIVRTTDGSNADKPKSLTPEQLQKQEREAKLRSQRRLQLMNEYKLQYQQRYEEMKKQLKKKHMDEIRRRKEASDAAKILESGRLTTMKKLKSTVKPNGASAAPLTPKVLPPLSNEGKTTKEVDAFEQAKSWSQQVSDQKEQMKRMKPMTKEEKQRHRKKLMDDYKTQHKQMRRELKERLKRKHLAEIKLIQDERERRLKSEEKKRKEEERKRRLPKPSKYTLQSDEKKPKAKLITISNTTPSPPPKKDLSATETQKNESTDAEIDKSKEIITDNKKAEGAKKEEDK